MEKTTETIKLGFAVPIPSDDPLLADCHNFPSQVGGKPVSFWIKVVSKVLMALKHMLLQIWLNPEATATSDRLECSICGKCMILLIQVIKFMRGKLECVYTCLTASKSFIRCNCLALHTRRFP